MYPSILAGYTAEPLPPSLCAQSSAGNPFRESGTVRNLQGTGTVRNHTAAIGRGTLFPVAFGGQPVPCKGRWRKLGNLGSFKIWNSQRDEGTESSQASKVSLEKALAQLQLKETHSEGTSPQGLRVCFHLFTCICLTLSHVNSIFAWPANPLLFLFLHYLNVINWRLCFPSMGLERREVLHIHRTLCFSFFYLFLSLPTPLLYLFLVRFWQFAFPAVKVWPHLLLNEFEIRFSYYEMAQTFISVRSSLFVVSLPWFVSLLWCWFQSVFLCLFSHAPCFVFEPCLYVLDLADAELHLDSIFY